MYQSQGWVVFLFKIDGGSRQMHIIKWQNVLKRPLGTIDKGSNDFKV